jgi:hypothetical protein
MNQRPHIWSVVRRGREARAALAREWATDRHRFFEPLSVWLLLKRGRPRLRRGTPAIHENAGTPSTQQARSL